MTKEQKNTIKRYADYISGVVSSKSAFNIPYDLLETIKVICGADGKKFCYHCNGSLYNAFKYIYETYVK